MKTILYLILTLTFFLYSCEDMVQKIDWETKNIPQKLIVEGNITNTLGKHPITLKCSDDYFANQPAKMVSNANITVSFGNTAIQYAENPDIPGLYESENEFSGELNLSYTLTIKLEEPIDGTTDYKAESELTEGMRIDSVSADLYINPIMSGEEDSLIIIAIFYGLEPAKYSNYYMLKLFRNGQILSDTINSFSNFSDQEYGINGESAIGMFLNEEYSDGDTLGYELYSIPKEFDLFLDGINQISQPSDPFGFSGPPANATGNINNGQGLGFFYAAHVSKGEVVVRDKSKE